jgi:hypothetical protein
MELNTFITQALTQILKGIEDANNKVTDGKSADEKTKPFLLKHGGSKENGTGIEFDVAVTIKSERGAKGGAKAKFLSVAEIDAGAQTSTTNEQASRIKFMVFVNQWRG